MASLHVPPELWCHIFHFLSTADEIADCSQDAWANIVTNHPKHEYLASRTVIECNRAKCALSLVSKSFYELSRPVVLESIVLRTEESLQFVARQIEERPDFARDVRWCTKLIYFKMKSWDFAPDRNKQIINDSELLLRSCQNLTCLVLPDYCWDGWEQTVPLFASAIGKSCTFLELLRVPRTPKLPSDFFSTIRSTGLRVLDLTTLQTRDVSALKPCEFPHLHTLIGCGEDVCSYFAEIRLPSLRTLVLNRKSRTSLHLSRFLNNHGGNVESLDMSGWVNSFCHWISRPLPNVKKLVMLDTEGVAISGWTNVREFGISGRALSPEFVLHKLNTIEYLRERGRYPNLSTIRIINDDAAQLLRVRSTKSLRLHEKKLHGWSIRLEDGHGELLVRPSQ